MIIHTIHPRRWLVPIWVVSAAVIASAQIDNISTVAGGGVPVDLQATSWGADGTTGVTVDASGNSYIALIDANQVWVVNSSGVVTKVIGNGIAGYSGDSGPATAAELNQPFSVAVDANGNLYIADAGNNVVREVSASTGYISTVAGNGAAGYGGDGAAATSAELNFPASVAVDAGGNLYIADSGNSVIRQVLAATGKIGTVAGNGTAGYTGDAGLASSAQLNVPYSVALDSGNNLYIADTGNNVIREIVAATGKIGTIAGNGTPGYTGDNGLPTSAELDEPYGVTVDSIGNLYIADSNNSVVREVSVATGDIATIAGNGTRGYAGDGAAATSAELYYPIGIAADSSGNVYIADYDNNRVREVSAATSNIITVAGNGTDNYGGDGRAATGAGLYYPAGIATDSSGNLYIADTGNNVVRKVAAATGDISTVAGNGTPGYTGDGKAAINAELSAPYGVALDSNGNLFIADTSNSVIREVAAATGNISTVAGNGTAGYSGDSGAATSAELDEPFGIAVDPMGNLYIADTDNFVIREVSAATGNISTIAGIGVYGYSGDSGPATSAQLSYPAGITLDSGGNVYFADYANNRIREISATTSNIATVAGNGTGGFSGDGGAATSAELDEPIGVAVDSSGNLYIADFENDLIREVSASTQNISTIAGNGMNGYSGDGGPATSAELAGPEGVAVSFAGRIYVADASNYRIRAFPDPTTPTITWPAPASIVAGTALSAMQLDATANIPGTFVYTPASGTVLSAGNNQTLSVTFTPADTIDYSTTTATTTISVTAGTAIQTIAFDAIPTQIVSDPPLTLNASASSGLAVMFTSNSTGVCTVSGATVNFVGSGTCSITASQPGSATFAPANPVTVTFTVDPAFADVISTGQDANVNASQMQAIDLMLSNGITSGCSASPFDYCTDDSITRAQMAVFIVRAILGTNDFVYNPTAYFTDVTSTPTDPNYSQFFKYIQKLKDLGITSGCTATTYCPNETVSRGQMAVFIIRARYGAGFPFNYTQTPYFTDVSSDPTDPNYSQFFEYIQKMKDVGITSGCTATTYCPNDDVTRGEMALFIMRGGFNQLLPAGTPVIGSVSPATGTAGNTVNVIITGTNTSFASGTTTIGAGAGFTVQNLVVNSATSLTAQLALAANATLGPESIVVTTGTQEAVAPNGFTITADPATGAIAYWTGNGVALNTISGMNGTLMGNATYAAATSRTQGVPDAQAFSLDGTNSYVQAASSETATVSGARTLVAWVYPNAITGLGQPILTGGSTYAAGDIFGITGTMGTCGAGVQYQLYIDDGGTCYVSNISLAPNTWSLVVVTFDGANAVFYVNNVASTPVPAQMNAYGLSTYEIGGNTLLGGSSTGASFNGQLSEVQIYDRALSPVEIQGIYGAP